MNNQNRVHTPRRTRYRRRIRRQNRRYESDSSSSGSTSSTPTSVVNVELQHELHSSTSSNSPRGMADGVSSTSHSSSDHLVYQGPVQERQSSTDVSEAPLEHNASPRQARSLSSTSTNSQVERNNIGSRDDLYGINDSEEDGFPAAWVRDARNDLLQESSDDSHTDSDVDSMDSNAPANNEFAKLRDFLSKEENNTPVNGLPVVSEAEILLAVLKYALVYDLSQTAIADLFKMLNCFFGFEILPSTRYLVDQMFSTDEFVEYHAICRHCKMYISSFKRTDRRKVCNNCGSINSLKDQTYTHFFAIFNVRNQIIDALESNGAYYNSVVRDKIRNNNIFADITDGLLYQRFVDSLPIDVRKNYATCIINTDGSRTFESSKFSIWPIQMNLNEVPIDYRTSKLFTCGIWFGKDKPNMDIFLDPFIAYINNLAMDGVTCTIEGEVRRIKLFALCCCVDSAARCNIQGITQYNGYFECSWCLHPGQYVWSNRGGSVKYVVYNEIPPKRTNFRTLLHMEQSVESGRSIYGVKKLSAITKLSHFNIVDGFVPDEMHAVSLGLGPQFCEYWMKSVNTPYSLSAGEKARIDFIMTQIKVPNKVARLSRSIHDRKFWTAKEWQNWILYYSLPILSSFPHMRIYAEHWALLVTAFHILLKPSITRQEIVRAHNLLVDFVAFTQVLYSESAMTYNLHQMYHLAQSVAFWGPLWGHSCYCFENGNGKILRQVHAAKGVVHQICRSTAMYQSELILKNHLVNYEESNVLDYVNYLEKNLFNQTFKVRHEQLTGHYGPSKHDPSMEVK